MRLVNVGLFAFAGVVWAAWFALQLFGAHQPDVSDSSDAGECEAAGIWTAGEVMACDGGSP